MSTQRAPPLGDKDTLFRLLVEKVKDYAIFALDPSGIVVSWNAGAEHIKGYRAHEIIGHHFSRFYPEDAIRSGWPQTELENAARDGRFEDEGWRIRKDGSRFWANVVITALIDDSGTLVGFAKVTRDLTEPKRVERLEADAQRMGEFVAMLAHELRNPLAPIRSAASVARLAVSDPEKQSWALGVIERQADQLTKLVDDLLDVSRITRGEIRLVRRRVRIGAALDRALESVRDAAAAKQQTIEVTRTADPTVRGDLVRLTQVISNLLQNACKFTQAGGAIAVTLDDHQGSARVSVRDNGIGIPVHLLPRVFDLFTQDKRDLARSAGGLGLGLAIARRLIEMHRGTITARSAGRGCGSEFTFKLPVFASGADSESDRLNVLIVDDNRDAASTLQMLLELHGHQCSVAFDGESGLDAAKRLLPDLILLDIGLPGMNGYQLARRIRAIPELEGVALAAISGYASDDDRHDALEAGFDAHLSKPVRYEALVRALAILQEGNEAPT